MSAGAYFPAITPLAVTEWWLPFCGGVICYMLRLCHLQIGHGRVRVMCKPNPIHSISRLELSRYHQLRLIQGLHYRAVDDARNLIALHLHRDLLRDGLPCSGGLVHRIARFAPSIQLERIRPEPSHNEISAAIGRAVDVALLTCP